MLVEKFIAVISKESGTEYSLGPFPLYEQAKQEILNESEEVDFIYAQIEKVFVKEEVN